MSDPETVNRPETSQAVPKEPALWSSSIYRLCEEIISLRETNNRQHKLFEQSQLKMRETLQQSFNSFAADTQKAYQQLRQEIHGDLRISLALLNELLQIGIDMETVVSSRPQSGDPDEYCRWADSVEVQFRKIQAALARHGIHPYDAVIGAAYDPRLHERVGSKVVEGMGPLRVAEQRERGYASQQPGFVLRRPKVIVSE